MSSNVLIQMEIGQNERTYSLARHEMEWLLCDQEISCPSEYGKHWCNESHHPRVGRLIAAAEKPYKDWFLHHLCRVIAFLNAKHDRKKGSLMTLVAQMANFEEPEKKELPFLVLNKGSININRVKY